MTTQPPTPALLEQLHARLGDAGFTRDPERMDPWLTDWRGRYRGAAAALLSPGTVDEVQAILRLCAAHRVALVPQGGNSSVVGGATPGTEGQALLLSLRRMDQVRRVSPDDGLLVAEAGVTLAAVHDAALRAGRRFPLSLAAKGSATVGGLVSTNAGGTQVLRFGTMRALVAGVEAVLPSGERLDGLSPLRKDNRGYDVGALLIGAEGTLGVVTAAALRLVPLAARSVAWAGLAEPHAALTLLRRLEASGLSVESFELVPARALELVLGHIPGTRAPLGQAYSWNALIEVTGAADPLRALEEELARASEAGSVADATIAASEAQADALWRLRETISEAERMSGVAVQHDVSVPVARMPSFIVKATRAVEARFAGTHVIAFGHLGDGNVHFNVRAPAGADRAAWSSAEAPGISRFVHDLVTAEGGSISAEHGIGQFKLGELQRTGDPVRLAAQAAIKRALDPQGIMNPGKLVPVPRSLAQGGGGT